MRPRRLYLVFVRLTDWMAPMARSATSKDAELLVLRQEVAALPAEPQAKPGLGGPDGDRRPGCDAPRPLRMSRLVTSGAMLCRDQSLTAQMRVPNIVRQPSV